MVVPHAVTVPVQALPPALMAACPATFWPDEL